ncbi:MAG: hypothetical protein NW207_03775 [Cytophagales bacterium]|nr:hypothetical protein [Cytophagales bacterium]
MATYTVVISTPESEKDFADFLSSHTDVEATPTEPIQYDPNIYDAEGNYKEIDVHLPGLPLSPQYLEWYHNLCDNHKDEDKDLTLEELKQRLSVKFNANKAS